MSDNIGMTTVEAGFVTDRGALTAEGRAQLRRGIEALRRALEGHLDNTGAACRVDLAGHDCCHVCNLAEVVLAERASSMVRRQADGHYPGCARFGCKATGCGKEPAP